MTSSLFYKHVKKYAVLRFSTCCSWRKRTVVTFIFRYIKLWTNQPDIIKHFPELFVLTIKTKQNKLSVSYLCLRRICHWCLCGERSLLLALIWKTWITKLSDSKRHCSCKSLGILLSFAKCAGSILFIKISKYNF